MPPEAPVRDRSRAVLQPGLPARAVLQRHLGRGARAAVAGGRRAVARVETVLSLGAAGLKVGRGGGVPGPQGFSGACAPPRRTM